MADQVRSLANDVPTSRSRAGHDKPYLLDFRLDVLPSESPLARLALHPSVVATATAHLRMVPVLAGVTVLRSPYVAGPPSGSQLFDSDWEDVSQLKLFVHCSDVTSSNGPLTALPAAAWARVKEALHYRYGGRGFRRADDEVLALVEPDQLRSFEGPEGTAVFVDTSTRASTTGVACDCRSARPIGCPVAVPAAHRLRSLPAPGPPCPPSPGTGRRRLGQRWWLPERPHDRCRRRRR